MALGSSTEASHNPGLSFRSTQRGKEDALMLAEPYSGSRVSQGLAGKMTLKSVRPIRGLHEYGPENNIIILIIINK